jgi:hypothetical protein
MNIGAGRTCSGRERVGFLGACDTRRPIESFQDLGKVKRGLFASDLLVAARISLLRYEVASLELCYPAANLCTIEALD